MASIIEQEAIQYQYIIIIQFLFIFMLIEQPKGQLQIGHE
jgi:hypothetical protein